MPMTALPPAPQTSDPVNFAAKADALVAALALFVTEANALGTPGLGGGVMTGALDFAVPVTVASAATTANISAAASNVVYLSGTVTTTAFPNPSSGVAGCFRIVKHTGIHQLTNSANLILVGGANRTYAVGDVSVFVYEGASVWHEWEYQPASDAPIQQIGSAVASNSASLVFTNLPTKFKRFRILLNDCVLATSNASLNLQFTEDGGSTWKTASYYWAATVSTEAASNAAIGASADTAIHLTGATGNAGTLPIVLTIEFDNPAITGQYKSVSFTGQYPSNTNLTVALFGSGNYQGDTNAVNGFRLIPSSGNITSGSVSLEGVL
jgi:hypothetical protein